MFVAFVCNEAKSKPSYLWVIRYKRIGTSFYAQFEFSIANYTLLKSKSPNIGRVNYGFSYDMYFRIFIGSGRGLFS